MSDKAAIRATFSDWRTVKGRKCLQLIFEVPMEQQSEVLGMLGAPMPDNPMWVGIAKLNVENIKLSHTKLSLESVLRCREPLFQRYLEVSNENEAAEAVRAACGIASRAGLNTDPEAARAWRTLDSQFLAWKRGAA